MTQSPAAGFHRGVTIVEVGVSAACIAVLLAAIPPTAQQQADEAKVTQSLNNLRILGAATANYSADWGDRQFTAVPDDFGQPPASGKCSAYLEKVQCPPQQVLGFSGDKMWGYFLGGGKCADRGFPGGCESWPAYAPIQFAGAEAGFGSFRITGAKSFHDYVNGRYYDPTLFAPKDEAAFEAAKAHFGKPDEFVAPGEDGRVEFGSYCFSPAAMWDAKVLLREHQFLDGNGFTAPESLPRAFRSPPISRCKYPSLKTQMLEHNWLQGRPGVQFNPRFAGGKTPWFFNHGIDSAPASLFFDGHIEIVNCQRAMDADRLVAAPGASTGSTWSRNTPFGKSGYFGGQSRDFLVNTSFHILTTDGIEGRDVIGGEHGPAKPVELDAAQLRPEGGASVAEPGRGLKVRSMASK